MELCRIFRYTILLFALSNIEAPFVKDGFWCADWSSCSRSCGGGMQSTFCDHACGDYICRKRRDLRFGLNSRTCNTFACPSVNCEWGPWTSWSGCSLTCGTGVKDRTRVKSVNEANGGTCSGLSNERSSCSINSRVDCTWGPWGTWGSCSKTCNSGTKTRTRTKAVAESCGGSCAGSSSASTTCSGATTSDCQWGSWGGWGSCSKSCGSGTKRRTRSVSKQSVCGGSCPGSSSHTTTCTKNTIVDCTWGPWGTWGSCSKTCNSGTKTRTRTKAVTESCGGSCAGSYSASTTCSGATSSDCQWGSWGAWGSCGKSCGSGTKRRTRSVSRPSVCGGSCTGSSSSTASCTDNSIVSCEWGSWGAWGTCSVSCGGGTQSSRRSKLVQESCGGGCSGSLSKTQACNTGCCPVGCIWNQWSAWGTCKDSCGSSMRTRTRGQSPAVCGGEMCQGETEDAETCSGGSAPGCPVDCTWSPWGVWSECSVSCGSGFRTLRRTKSISEKNGGTCSGGSETKQNCEMNLNPTDCILGLWGDWGECKGSCLAGGIQVRTREVLLNPTACGIPCDTNHIETQNCMISGCGGSAIQTTAEVFTQQNNVNGQPRDNGLPITTLVGIGVGGCVFIITVIVITVGIVTCCKRKESVKEASQASSPPSHHGAIEGETSADTTYTELKHQSNDFHKYDTVN